MFFQGDCTGIKYNLLYFIKNLLQIKIFHEYLHMGHIKVKARPHSLFYNCTSVICGLIVFGGKMTKCDLLYLPYNQN